MLCEDFTEQCEGRCFKSDVLLASIKTYPGGNVFASFEAILKMIFTFPKVKYGFVSGRKFGILR